MQPSSLHSWPSPSICSVKCSHRSYLISCTSFTVGKFGVFFGGGWLSSLCGVLTYEHLTISALLNISATDQGTWADQGYAFLLFCKTCECLCAPARNLQVQNRQNYKSFLLATFWSWFQYNTTKSNNPACQRYSYNRCTSLLSSGWATSMCCFSLTLHFLVASGLPAPTKL